jgi:NADH-quinone oxidoreductase subunit M
MDLNVILLQLAVAVPLICAVLVLLGRGVRPLSVMGFTLPALMAFWLAFQFDPTQGQGGYAFLNTTQGGLGYDLGMGRLLGIRLVFGLNGLSMPLFVMAALVGFAAGAVALRSQIKERRHIYLGLLLLMHGGLMGVFASVDIFYLYFFHELALIATFILIGLWGGPNRRTIALEVTIYLTLGAMLSLIGLICLYVNLGLEGAGFNLIALREAVVLSGGIDGVTGNQIFGLLLLGCGILVSLFPFHSWAPNAYSAAPTANSMLHAGVLKKFGLYVLLQVAATLLPTGMEHWSELLIWLALGNIVLIGLVTVAQHDLKRMVSCSSVMHMGYVFLGLASLSILGAGAAALLMFAHGLSVALLFMLGQFVYERTGTFDMRQMGGLGPKAPLLAAAFVLATFGSAGLPGMANFWGEFGVFIALGQAHLWAVPIAAIGIVISAVYGLRSVARIFYGQPTEAFATRLKTVTTRDLRPLEVLPTAVLLAALVLVGFWPKLVSTPINEALKPALSVVTATADPQPSPGKPVLTDASTLPVEVLASNQP